MRLHPARMALCALLGASILSCTDSLTSVRHPSPSSFSADGTASIAPPQVVISQIYGGGGNSGATWKNDFVELFNPGSQPVDLTGWSVQYASSTGSFTQVTALAKTIPAGGYYLVQEAAGAGGTTSLPTPDATGTIAMAAGAAKVAVVHSTAALGVACPAADAYVDLVSYGSGTACGTFAPTLTNTTAALRNDSGCAYTNDPKTDFSSGPPTPRNGASGVHVCPGALPVGPLDHVAIAGATTLTVGGTAQLTATPQDANNQTVPDATITGWSTSDENVATIDNAGKLTAVSGSATPVTITATAQQGSIATSGTIKVTITTPAIKWIDISSSSTSFPPGFQTQLFATARTAQGGAVIDANFTFEALDPDVATIANVANTGIVTGVAAPNGAARPRLRIIATPKVDNGTPPDTFVTTSITIEAPLSAPQSIYATNDEFGDPTAAGSANPNDLLIQRPQYTLSYNESRGTPNWVAYELDARQIIAGQDRCNCFTADPSLPGDKQILTSDYTNGGYDRGHMARSADRTTANVDNASTFYLTNIVPQQADLNQGVWAQFENALGDSATKGGRAVYIITGPLYSRSHAPAFLKNEGKVAIPDSTWKIALIGPRSDGNPFTRGNVQSWNDLAGLTILAASMPNVSGVRNDPWAKYLTTVNKIEQATGYDFLTVLNGAFRAALEVGDRAPVAQYAVAGSAVEGTMLSFDASSSTDPDVGRSDLGRTEGLSYAWQFGDGSTATGRSVTHAFSKYGPYTATLTVTDAFGWPTTVSQTLNVGDVAPALSSLPNSDLIEGESYGASGSFADPGIETWRATVDYGDGGGAGPLALAGKSFTVAHRYGTAGMFTLTVAVTDDGGATGSAAAAVHVVTAVAAIQGLAQQLQLLAESGGLAPQDVRPLLASLDAASKQIQRGNNAPAINELGALLDKLTASVISGRMSPDAAQQLNGMVARIQRVLGG